MLAVITPARGIQSLAHQPVTNLPASPIVRTTPIVVSVGSGVFNETTPSPSGTTAMGSGHTSAANAGSLDTSAVAATTAAPSNAPQPSGAGTSTTSTIFGISTETALIIAVVLALLLWFLEGGN